MNETQQQVQQSIYNSGIVGSAISDNVNETKALAQVQAQGSQDKSTAIPVAIVQPLNSDDIALPQQNSNSSDNTDYSSFFKMIASTLDAVNTNIQNFSSVISDAIDTLFPIKTAQSRSATNPIEKISSINQTQSDGGLGLLGSIAAGVGGASLLSTLFGGEDKKEPPPSNAPKTPPITPSTPLTTLSNEPSPTSDGSTSTTLKTPPITPSTPLTTLDGSISTTPKTPPTTSPTPPITPYNEPPSPNALKTPPITPSTPLTTLSNEPSPTSDGSTSAESPSQPPVAPSPVLDSTGVNPRNAIAGAQLGAAAANKASPTSVLGRGAGGANKLLGVAGLGYEGYERYTQGQSPGKIATVMGSGLIGAQGGAILGAKTGAVIGSLGGPIGAGIGAFAGGVVGGAVGYLGGEFAAESLFPEDNTGDKINQQSIEASNNKSEVNNINLPPQQVSQPAPATPQPQTSSPSVSDVPSCDRSLPETLDCKF